MTFFLLSIFLFPDETKQRNNEKSFQIDEFRSNKLAVTEMKNIHQVTVSTVYELWM